MSLEPIAHNVEGNRPSIRTILANGDVSVVLLACLIAACLPGNAASAQTLETAERTNTIDSRPQAFAIPRQPLPGAINAFIRATGWQVGYSTQLAANVVSPGVSGTMAPAGALQRLLRGTGLIARMTGPTTATLVGPSAQASNGDDDGAIMLDPINVAAEKIVREYFRTYTSVGIVTEDEIYEFGIPDLQRSFDLLGNVRSAPANRGNNGFVIRGLNSEGVTQPTSSAPIISVTIDGAIQNGEATRRGARGLWDVEQVEVLRGPQSTLQGRNALGGAVLVKTNDPTWTPEAIINGQVGTDKYRSGAFVLSGPLVPNQLAVRFAGQSFRETKDISYTDPAVAPLGKDEFDQIRGKVLITPDALPGFSALLTLSHTRDKPAVNAVTGPDFFARRFDSSGTAVEFRDARVTNYVADLSYALAPGWAVKSITAFVDTDATITTPPGAAFERDELRAGGDFSQDLRLTFDPPGSPLSGVIGLFAGHFSIDVDSLISTTLFGPSLTIQDLVTTNTTTSVAAYADVRYRFLERWSLILGGRILRDEVENSADGTTLDFNTLTLVPLKENTAISNTVFLPKVGLAFDLTPTQTLAATANRGYRPGFGEVVAGRTTINDVAPEYLWSYELAYRSRWFNDRLQLNSNVFYYDYRNQQVVIDNPLVAGTTITQNAGKSHAYGAEIEARAKVLDGLTMFASVGLLKTEFDEGVATLNNTSFPLNGKSFPEAPAVTASLGGIYKHRSGLFAAANVSFTDGYYSAGDLLNDPRRFVGSYTLVNARLGYETEHGAISIFARNLLDEQYLTSIAAGYNEATIGDGRMIGIRATGRW